jgi:hypothetical protein
VALLLPPQAVLLLPPQAALLLPPQAAYLQQVRPQQQLLQREPQLRHQGDPQSFKLL